MSIENAESIGSRIREERERLGITQKQLADAGRVSKRSQINYEHGERQPDAQYLAAIKAAGVDLIYILTGERENEPKMVLLQSEEVALIDMYRSLPSKMQSSLRQYCDAMALKALQDGSSRTIFKREGVIDGN